MKTLKSPHDRVGRIRRYSYALAALWTVLVSISLAWNLFELNRKTLEAARIQARTAHTKDVDYRSWNTTRGGVYVPVTRQTRPNPYLKTPKRDVTTTTGQGLTLVNPAYMTRMVHRIGENRYGVRGHITSLKPIRPENAADVWETKALQEFENGLIEVSSVENLGGSSFMRLMRPLITEGGCLKCHSSQGYKKGDVRGGISVAVPMEPLWAASHKEIVALAIGHSVLWLVGLVGLYVGARSLTGTFRDLELSKESLRKSEEQYRLLFENAGVLVSVHDGEGVCLLMNKTVAESFGDLPGNSSGSPFMNFIPKPRTRYVRRIREVMDTGQPKDYEDLVTFPQGPRWLLSNMHPVRNEDGNILGAQIVSQDITDRKNSEELRRTVERFRAISDLANGVAHNFNNLLQIVIGHLELSIDDLERENYEQVKETLEKILERSKSATETVGRLQTFAGLQNNNRVAETMVFDLSLVAKQAIEMSKTWWERPQDESDTQISVDEDLQAGGFVNGDENQVFSVVLGLIRNAVEAVKESGGGRVIVDSYVQDDQVILRVRDTGVGISPENIDRIFNPFFTTKAQQGSGLTLATSQKIIEDHGGNILVESTVTKGSTFTVILPLAEETIPDEEAASHPKLNRSLTVLAIDDEEAIVDLIKSWMEKHGHRAFTAVSGEEGLNLLSENPVDVVICDLGMPGINGWDVGKKIRDFCDERGLVKPPFIILTGWGGQVVEAESMAESGVDAVVEKPLNMQSFFDVIQQVVEKKS